MIVLEAYGDDDISVEDTEQAYSYWNSYGEEWDSYDHPAHPRHGFLGGNRKLDTFCLGARIESQAHEKGVRPMSRLAAASR